MKKSTHNRLIALLLVLFMLVSMIPVTVQATEADPPTTETTTPAESEPPPEPEPQPEPEPEPQPEPQPEPEPEPQPEPQPEPEEVQEEQTARQDAAMAGGTPDNTYGHVVLNFNESSTIKLYSGQYIVYCNASTPVLNAIGEPTDGYLVWYHEGILYLNGDLQNVRISLYNAKRFPNESQRSVLVYVKDNVTMSGHNTLLDLQDSTNATLHIDPGKCLTLNLTRNAQSTTRGAAIYGAGGSNLTVIGGGELHINAYGSGDTSGAYTYTFGIALRGDLTLSSGIYSAGSPDVRINVSNDSTNTESDKVIGVDVHGLTVKDESFLKIDVTGRALDPNTEGDSYREGAIWGRVNGAINAVSMKLLDKASVDIISRKNVVSDIALTGGGEVLMVDTKGYFHITNYGDITRYPDDDNQHKLSDHPDANIYLSNKDATANIVRVEAGMVIDSYSRIVDKWYDNVINGEDQWNWAIGRGYQGSSSSIGKEPTLGTHMYVGTRRIGKTVEISASDHRYTWGKYEYIYSPAGVATVKQSSGLTMDWEKPEGSSSSVHYARVIEPGFNNIHVVHKGADLSLEAPDGKGTFLYWYDALHPEGSGNGTSWTKPNQTFSNIQQDMVLVPVRDPMKTGPTLSAVSYTTEYDSDTGTTTRYAYQDMTFEKEDNISNNSGYRVMLVPAQLPRYGENTYAAVKDLKGSPVMGLRNSRLYADAKPSGAYGTTLAWENIPEGSYRIAYYDDETNKCFFSKPFTFDPPVAPPYIDPGTQFYDSGGTKTVKITAERNQPIKYRQWDYTKNQWGTLQKYNGPFDVTVTAAQDVRIEAYAGPIPLDRRSEVRYAMRPTGVPTVKYGDTVLSTTDAYLPNHYFYGSIELTVEATDGYEVWYDKTYAPYETNNGIEGTKVGEDGKVTITDSGEFHFKLAKVFTVDGVQYRKLANSYTRVKLVKQNELPAPEVTFYDGETKVTPGENNTVLFHEKLTATLSKPRSWPINAEMGYSRSTYGGLEVYQTPVEYTAEGILRVYTQATLANGSSESGEKVTYTIQQDPSYVTKTLSVRKDSGIKVYDINNVLLTPSTPGGISNKYTLNVGRQFTVEAPLKSGDKVFRYWSVSNGPAVDFDNKNSPRSTFVMPNGDITVKANYDTPYNISGTTILKLMPTAAAGMNLRLHPNYSDWQSLSYQWYEGNTASGTPLNNFDSFEIGKTYTARVKVTATEGVIFTSSANIKVQQPGSSLEVANDRVERAADNSYLAFDLHLLTKPELTMELVPGNPLPTAADLNKQLPTGYTVTALTWANDAAKVPDNATEVTITKLEIRPAEGSYQLANSSVWINGTECPGEFSSGTLTLTGITVPVKPKGVEVSGIITSYGSDSESVTVQLIAAGHTEPAYEAIVTGNSATYSFETVPAGAYTLKVMKKGHAPLTENITVDGSAVTKNVTIHLIGDVNKDGVVTPLDMQRLYNHLNGTAILTDTTTADVNQDGSVTPLDMQRLYNHLNGTGPLF